MNALAPLLVQGGMLAGLSGLQSSPLFPVLIIFAFLSYLWKQVEDKSSIVHACAPGIILVTPTYSMVSVSGTVVHKHTPWNVSTNSRLSPQCRALLKHLEELRPAGTDKYKLIEVHDKKGTLARQVYIPDCKFPFRLSEDILCRVQVTTEEEEGRESETTMHQRFRIELFSKRKSSAALTEYIETIKERYLHSCRSALHDKLFVYRLRGLSGSDSQYWHEAPFTSTRSFQNVFIPNKQEFLKKLDFFRDNEEWYKQHGHPYTLGIGLHGPPGTGKTSLIKAIANYFSRHIVELPLSVIGDEERFFEAYFERSYGRADDSELDWSDKIILFEDIDAQSELLNRLHRPEKVSKVCVPVEGDRTDSLVEAPRSPPITLACVLNTIDGIRENHGRVMIITSNHYDKLDPAVKRPGRIDIEVPLENADKDLLGQIYESYYDQRMTSKEMRLIPDNFSVPTCEIIKISRTSPDSRSFLRNLLRRFKSISS